jgi:hypothetical protein
MASGKASGMPCARFREKRADPRGSMLLLEYETFFQRLLELAAYFTMLGEIESGFLVLFSLTEVDFLIQSPFARKSAQR